MPPRPRRGRSRERSRRGKESWVFRTLCDGAEQRRIGIDDWVITRGHRHGTIIVDLERRQPIDVLIGRESTIVVDWLRSHPTVRIVARDRAGAYSDAVQTVNSKVQQVADRWHLVVNMREAIERLLVRQHAKLREAASSLSEAIRPESNPVTADSRGQAATQRLAAPRYSAP